MYPVPVNANLWIGSMGRPEAQHVWVEILRVCLSWTQNAAGRLPRAL